MFFKHRPVVNGKKLKSAIMTNGGMKKYVPYIWVDPEEFFVKSENEPGIYEDFDSSDNDFLVYDINNAKLTEKNTVTIAISTFSNFATIKATTPTKAYYVHGRQLVFQANLGDVVEYDIWVGRFNTMGNFIANYSTNIYKVPTFQSPLSLPTNANRINKPDLILNDNKYRWTGGVVDGFEWIMQGLNSIDKTLLIDYTCSQIICPSGTAIPEWRDYPRTYTVNNIEFKQANIKYYNGNNFEYFKDIYTTNDEAIYFIGSQAASYLNIKPGVYAQFVPENYQPGEIYWSVIESITLKIA